LLACQFLIACQTDDNVEALRLQVLEADKNFNRMAQEKGIAKAFFFMTMSRCRGLW
jgi:hypothetical protein